MKFSLHIMYKCLFRHLLHIHHISTLKMNYDFGTLIHEQRNYFSCQTQTSSCSSSFANKQQFIKLKNSSWNFIAMSFNKLDLRSPNSFRFEVSTSNWRSIGQFLTLKKKIIKIMGPKAIIMKGCGDTYKWKTSFLSIWLNWILKICLTQKPKFGKHPSFSFHHWRGFNSHVLEHNCKLQKQNNSCLIHNHLVSQTIYKSKPYGQWLFIH